MPPTRTKDEPKGGDGAQPFTERYPKPPYPRQHQQPPGLESELEPAPRWRGEHYKAAGKLEGLVALVTGGDSGIGRSVAYFFAREGADVAITCMAQEGTDAADTMKAVEGLGRRCMVLPGDLSEAEFCDAAVRRVVEEFGWIDILVHNAAWQNRKPVTELVEEEIDFTIKTNVYAYLRLARSAVPHMKPGSSIIATGSIVGISGSEELSDYGATKGAIHAITKCLAEELSEKQIRVNCVAPGPVWTPLNPSDTGLKPAEVAKFGKDSTLQGRPAQPEEIAPAFVFLASLADSSFINGVVLPVTGKPV